MNRQVLNLLSEILSESLNSQSGFNQDTIEQAVEERNKPARIL